MSVAQVLSRANIGTRAFYRHFESKDQLVSAVFLDMARAETRRLRKRMATSPDPVRAVVAWIDGRLDLAFSDAIKSDLRQISLEAQSQMFASPEVIGDAYAEILTPLVEQLERGVNDGCFTDVDPAAHALSIQGVLVVQRRKAMGRRRLRSRATCDGPSCSSASAGSASRRHRSRKFSPKAPPTSPRRGTTDSRRSMDLGLSGSAAVVTGGSKGMGLAIAETLAADGARVAVMARGQAALDCCGGIVACRRSTGCDRHQRRHDRRRLHRRRFRHRGRSVG